MEAQPAADRADLARVGGHEVVTIAPKGNHKTTTMALAGVHELVSNPDADVIVGADYAKTRSGDIPKVPLPGRYYRYRLDVVEAFERGELDSTNGEA